VITGHDLLHMLYVAARCSVPGGDGFVVVSIEPPELLVERTSKDALEWRTCRVNFASMTSPRVQRPAIRTAFRFLSFGRKEQPKGLLHFHFQACSSSTSGFVRHVTCRVIFGYLVPYRRDDIFLRTVLDKAVLLVGGIALSHGITCFCLVVSSA
jgi:hypothetical protein